MVTLYEVAALLMTYLSRLWLPCKMSAPGEASNLYICTSRTIIGYGGSIYSINPKHWSMYQYKQYFLNLQSYFHVKLERDVVSQDNYYHSITIILQHQLGKHCYVILLCESLWNRLNCVCGRFVSESWLLSSHSVSRALNSAAIRRVCRVVSHNFHQHEGNCSYSGKRIVLSISNSIFFSNALYKVNKCLSL